MHSEIQAIYDQMTTVCHHYNIPIDEETAVAQLQEYEQGDYFPTLLVRNPDGARYRYMKSEDEKEARFRQERQMNILANVLHALFPTRYLEYDTERINDAVDYETLLTMFANITDGEWQPQNITATMADGEPDDLRAVTIQFSHGNWRPKWQLVQNDDWVSDEFNILVNRFASKNLPGDFVELPDAGQVAIYMYLPRPIAQRVTERLASYTARLFVAASEPLWMAQFIAWDYFTSIHAEDRLRRFSASSEFVMDPGEPITAYERDKHKRPREDEADTPINWDTLLVRTPASDPNFSPEAGRLSFYFPMQVSLVNKALKELWFLGGAINTILVPFAMAQEIDNQDWFQLALDDHTPEHPSYVDVIATHRIFGGWARLSQETRDFGEELFKRPYDLRTEIPMDVEWYCAAIVHLARQALITKLPILFPAQPRWY